MTLNQLFTQIDANYSLVKSTVNSIIAPVRSTIDQKIAWARIFSDTAKYYINSNWASFNREIWQYSREVIYALENLTNETFVALDSTRSKLQTAINYYMQYVVTNVENAISFVEDELFNEVLLLELDIDAGLNEVRNYMYTEIERLQLEVDQLNADVIDWIDGAVAGIKEEINLQIEEVNTNLTGRIDFIEQWTTETIDSVYKYMDIQLAELTQYIDDANDTLYYYINSRIKETEDYIAEVQNILNIRLTSEVEKLSEEIAAVEVSLTARLQEIIDASNWTLSFFDLFTFRPELSLLRVLLRPDSEFKKYKPYWQALFARVLEED